MPVSGRRRTVRRSPAGPAGCPPGGVFGAGGDLVATVGSGSVVRVFNGRTGDVVASVDHGADVTDAAITPDGARLVTTGADRIARVWSVRRRPARARARGPPRAYHLGRGGWRRNARRHDQRGRDRAGLGADLRPARRGAGRPRGPRRRSGVERRLAVDRDLGRRRDGSRRGCAQHRRESLPHRARRGRRRRVLRPVRRDRAHHRRGWARPSVASRGRG